MERRAIGQVCNRRGNRHSLDVRSGCAHREWRVSEVRSNRAAVVAEARLKPNDLTQPDTSRYSSTGAPLRKNAIRR